MREALRQALASIAFAMIAWPALAEERVQEEPREIEDDQDAREDEGLYLRSELAGEQEAEDRRGASEEGRDERREDAVGNDGDEAAPQHVDEASRAASGVRLGPFRLSGELRERYRFRTTSDESDQDLLGLLSLRLEEDRGRSLERRPWGRLEAELLLSHQIDLDSFAAPPPEAAFNPFFDIGNALDDRAHILLHSLHLSLVDGTILERLRAGRQEIFREVAFIFDGAHLRTQEWKGFSLEAFGGLPVHQYESSASGDGLAGGSIDWRPNRSLVIGVDSLWVRDERDSGPDTEDVLTILRGAWRIGREWRVRASGSWTGDRERRQMLALAWLSEAWGTSASLRFLRQSGFVSFQSSELSPYLLVEGFYAPYEQLALDLRQPIGDRFSIGGGGEIRMLEDDDDAGIFNHSFRNAWLAIEAIDLWEGMSASVRGDVWDADGEDIWTAGFELEQKLGEKLRLALGTSWALYRFDPFTGEERFRDRIYYGRVRWNALRQLDFDLEYRYENDSLTEYHVVIAGFRTWF